MSDVASCFEFAFRLSVSTEGGVLQSRLKQKGQRSMIVHVKEKECCAGRVVC